MSDFKAKMHQIRFPLSSAPDLAVFKGPTSKGREEEGKGEGKVGEGKGGDGCRPIGEWIRQWRRE